MKIFDRDAAVRMYLDGKSPHAVGKYFGVHHKVISRELRARGIEPRNQTAYRRRYTVDGHFFNKIDTEEKAYWLGFVAADGNVSKSNAQLTISLSRRDRQHLIKFANHIKTTSPVFDIVSKTPDGKPSLQSKIVICSRPITNDLALLGVLPKKSLTIKPSVIANELYRHYWRGVVDGDGWIANHKSGKITFGLCGSEHMCRAFQVFFKQFFPNLRKRKRTWSSEINTNTNAILAARLLYSDSNVYLDRKAKKAI